MATVVDVVGRIGAIASSASPPEERTEGILGEIRRLFPFDAAMVSTCQPGTVRGQPVVVHDYPADFVDYLLSEEWHGEAVAPFGVPRNGRPIREVDLPVDPMSLRGVAEFGRPAGLYEGALSALHTSSGHHIGFLMMSWDRPDPPPEEACEAVYHVSTALANAIDPLQSARALANTVEDRTSAVAISPDGTTLPLRGADSERLDPDLISFARDRGRVAGGPSSFLWPRTGQDWARCTVVRTRDDLVVLLERPLDDVHGLTVRELQVLSGLVLGRSNSALASEMNITTRTVRAHVQHIFEKFGVTSRAAAVNLAHVEGLLLPSAIAG